MSGPSTYQPQNSVIAWIERRLPIFGLIHSSFVAYPTPRNLNYWWTFGGILSFMLAVQIVTGVILAMHYTPEATMAFNSVESIVRDVNYGWLLRNLHASGASMFFIAVYVHMFRGLYYGSYKEPREVLWILGVIIYLLMMATGFMGYVLPWGQMSFWGATVITNLFSAVPYFGESIVTLLWGGYSVGNPTLNRFFSLHYLLPFLPWLDSAKTRSSKYRPLAKQFFWMFMVVCIGLGYLGAQPPEGIYVIVGRILTACYFAYFLILLPLLARIEKPRPVPNSIAEDVLAKSGGKIAASIAIALVVAGSVFAGSVQ